MSETFCRRFLLYLLTAAAAVGLAVLALRGVLRFALPFVWALLTAAALQRPLAFITRKTKMKRGIWSFLLVLLLVSLLAALAATVLWQAGNLLLRVVSNTELIDGLQQTVARVTERLQYMLSEWLPPEGPLAGTLLSRLSEAAMALLTDSFAAAAAWVGEWAVGGLPSFLFDFLIWVLASVLLTVEYRRVLCAVKAHLPRKVCALLGLLRRHGLRAVAKLCRAYALLMLLTFAELLLGFWILRIPHAPVLAAVVALVDILPVVGVGTVLLPWSAFLLLTGQTFPAVGLLALYLVITVVRNLLEPRIVGKQVGLPPLATLLFMYVGLQAGGIAGLFLLPLAAVVAAQLYREGVLPRIPRRTDVPQE